MSKFSFTFAATAIALLLGGTAIAQAQGTSKPTAEEKAQARAARKAEGSEAARNPIRDVTPESRGTRGAASREEREEARAERREEGAQAARNPMLNEEPNSMGARGTTTKEERKAARAERKAKVGPAVKSRQIPSGEK